MTQYLISKNGVTLWYGHFASEEAAFADYRKNLGSEFDADEDDAWNDQMDDMEIAEVDDEELARLK